jgi:hypothetical protein
MPFQHINGSTTLDGILAATRIAGHLPLHFSSRIIEIAWQIQDCRLNSNDFLYDFWANPVPFGSIKVGAWTGGAFTNDTTGAFSHCGAGAPYSSGIYFMVLVDANLDWALGFANENWSVKKDQVFQIALTFDGQTPFNVYGVAVSEKLVRVSMPTNSSLIAQFRKAKSMTAFTQSALSIQARSNGTTSADVSKL